MHYWVYVHTCKANGKRYVGITTKTKPEYRWLEGRGYQYNKHFYSAILKYGWDNFEHEAWELTCESEMYYAEKYLIAYYHTTESEFGYNHSTGGEHIASGCIRSEETRKKLSESHKKRYADPEVRRKMSEAARKSHSDPEVRRKMSLSHKGKSVGEETRKRISEIMKKRCSDPGVQRKMSEACRKKWTDSEYREKVSKALKGKSRSEGTRKRIAEAAKNRPRIKISLPDGTVLEMTKQNLTRNYINRGKKFEYVD